ncbi:MAG: hypothetical protein ACK5HT_18895 [Draconibacterium sp.]
MNPLKLTTKDYFKSLKIIHFALTLGVLFFTIISTVLMKIGFESLAIDEMNKAFLFAIPFFALAGIFGSNFLFNSRLKVCKRQANLRNKLDEYRSALVIKFALIEGPSFLTVIAYLLSGNFLFLGLILVLLAIMISYRPTKEKAINDLELDYNAWQMVENPDAVIE